VSRLDDVLRSVAMTRQRTQTTRASIDGLTAMMKAKQAAQSMAPGGVVPTAVRPPGAPSVGRATGGGGPVPTGGESDELWRRINKMTADSPHKITPGKRSRDYATQVRLWNAYKAGKGPMAAKPGTSKHGNGRANDLQYSNDAARAWALANASRYGLKFPIYNPNLARSRDESWHVELA
jgi:hypothetical protein